MYCPLCSEETRVLESRLIDNSVRRRRECLKCNNRFTTYEKAIFSLSVLKKDGREQDFDIEKIKSSVLKAFGKTNENTLINVTSKIQKIILSKKQNQIKTTDIGKIVLRELKRVDKIAYLRFATIHKEIEDTKILEKELHCLR